MFLRVATMAALLSACVYAQTPANRPAPAAVQLPDARTIVERHIKAIGGRAAILAHRSMHASGTMSSTSGPSGRVHIYGAAPDRSLVKASFPDIGEITEGYDGTHAWSVNPMTGAALKTGKELEQAKFDANFYSDLRDPATYTLTTIEKTPFGGRDCYKVRVKRADGSEDFDFYDVATGLRAGSITTRETQKGPVTSTITESGYKAFGTLMQMTVLTQKFGTAEQKITLEVVEFDRVNPSVFEPPAAVKALIK